MMEITEGFRAICVNFMGDIITHSLQTQSLFCGWVQVIITFVGSDGYLAAESSFIFEDLILLCDQRHFNFKLRIFITNTL